MAERDALFDLAAFVASPTSPGASTPPSINSSWFIYVIFNLDYILDFSSFKLNQNFFLKGSNENTIPP